MSKRKPRGENGPVLISSGDRSAEFLPNHLPDSKEAIEDLFASMTFAEMQRLQWDTWGRGTAPVRLRENDFDFLLDVSGRAEFLDLVEFAPLGEVPGGFRGLPRNYNRGKQVDAVVSLIRKKDSHYGVRRKTPTHLLVYSTDRRLLLSEGTRTLIKVVLRRVPPIFRTVSYAMQIEGESCVVDVLFPPKGGVPWLTREDERRHRESVVNNVFFDLPPDPSEAV